VARATLRFDDLTGEGNYDDGVHFAGALALVAGKLPYRDFLFLHPPVILLALSPFAALAHVTSEGFGFAVARVAWMVLGAFNATAVSRLLRPLGTLSAVVGGLAYALYFPAVYAESTTMLEGLANALLLTALLLVVGGRSLWRLGLAGVLLGLVPAVKIWGVVLVGVVIIWIWVTRGLRGGLTVLAASALSGTAVLLPFYLISPVRMWEMVVRAQLGRPDSPATMEHRAWAMLGLGVDPPSVDLAHTFSITALVFVAFCLWRNRTSAVTWLGVGLLLPAAGMLLVTPSFYQHYPAVMAVPVALILGSAVALTPGAGRTRQLGALALLPVVLVWGTAQVVHIAESQLNDRDVHFTSLRDAVESASGCVTSDDPAPLIELDVFTRDIERGCPVWIDLSGDAYVDDIGGDLPRYRNEQFQRQAMDYLARGEVAIVGREESLHYLDAASRRRLASWPVLASSDSYTAYRVVH
jgi:hypothetical protein